MRENPRSEAAPVRRESGLSVVMPAHDEADNLAAMLDDTCRELASTCARLEVLVVDDGSTDATPAVLAASVAAHPQLRVITLPARRGYGEAARVGLADAREELVLFTDADRQFQLADVETLLEAIGDGDLAVGYRFDRRDSPLRNGLGRAWSGLVNLLFGYTARDVDCALKLARRTALAEVLPEVRSRGAAFSAEWLIRARRAGQQIVELPVRHRPRCAGRPSGGSPAVALRGFVELLRLRATLPRKRRDRAAPGAP
jgi:glycosyltransferase involved in cell wall biosynthesis